MVRYRHTSCAGLAIAALFVATAAAAQDTVAVGVRTEGAGQELPRRVADTVIEFYNRPSTIRFSGRTRLPAERTIAGDVAILGGPVEFGGRVDGDVIVVNGDIRLLEGARILGDLTVVGGVVTAPERGHVDGVIHSYAAILRYRRTDEGIEYAGTKPRSRPLPTRTGISLPDWALGESEIYLSARAYNRVEGLPVAFGPRIRTGGHNPLLIELLGIYRTEGGFEVEDEDLGFELRARQYLGGHEDLWLEAAVQSIVVPIENWQLSNLENSLALFTFRRDYRDYYEREGWYGRIGWRSARTWSGWLEFRDERHASLDTRTPWTVLFNTDDEFQTNAAIDNGDLQSLSLTINYDTRNDRGQPWAGWYNQLSLEHALDGDTGGLEPDFTRFFLDLRRYNRVSFGSAVALRFVAGGRTGGSALPAQRQHVIGGVGSLPGYDQREFDCGARGTGFGDLASYGCQRFALFQIEYRTGLDFHFHWDADDFDDDYGDIFSVDFEPNVIFFYDAGAAWNTDDGFFDHLTETDNWVADIGAGLGFGGLGTYLAYPLVGSGGLNFFVRLTGRF